MPENRPTPAQSHWKQCFIVLALINLLQLFLLIGWLTKGNREVFPGDNLSISCEMPKSLSLWNNGAECFMLTGRR
jgi:hypothetical protein